MKTKYEVPMIYRGQTRVVVLAESEEEAERAARDLFYNDKPIAMAGKEWEVVSEILCVTPAPNRHGK